MKNKKKLLIFGFCFIVSTLILLFCSQNSPLYPMNDWVDVNAFMTVGKGMMKGLVPYKDLFEQKGPVLYLIYGIGYLITNNSFLGVFIIECIFTSIFLYYGYKIIKLFTLEKYAFLILPVMLTVIATAGSFCHGGSSEEFCFPFLMISLYHLLNYLKNNTMNSKIIFINGLIAGIVFLVKYTIIGFWFSWMMFIFFDFVLKKDIKKGIKNCFIFLSGMVIPFILFSIYFLISGAFKDFIDTYFIINITNYGNTSGNILRRIPRAVTIFASYLLNKNGIILFSLFVGIIFFVEHSIKSIKHKLYIYFTILISIIVTFVGGQSYLYYPLIWFPFIIFTFIELVKILNIIPKKLNNKIIFTILCIIVVIGCTGISYKKANYRFLLFKPKNELAQYQYAEIINKDKDKSLLNYGFLDLGFYFTTNQNPKLKHFEIQNINYDNYPDNWDSQKNCIKEKCVNYVVLISHSEEEQLANDNPNLLKNYKVINSVKQYQDYDLTYFYLLKRR